MKAYEVCLLPIIDTKAYEGVGFLFRFQLLC